MHARGGGSSINACTLAQLLNADYLPSTLKIASAKLMSRFHLISIQSCVSVRYLGYVLIGGEINNRFEYLGEGRDIKTGEPVALPPLFS